MPGLFGGGSSKTNTDRSLTRQEVELQQQQVELGRALSPIQIALSKLGGAQFGVDALGNQAGPSVTTTAPALLNVSEAERAVPGILGGINEPLIASLRGIQGDIQSNASEPLASDRLLGPLSRAFTETVIPEIKSASIRAGAPGGSVEQDLFERAVGRFGSEATDVLAQNELRRRTLANLALNQAAGFTPLLQQLQLQEPQGEAALAGQERSLQFRGATLPLELLLGATGGNFNAPGIPLPGGAVETTAQSGPTTGGQIGSGITSALTLALLASEVLA